MAWPEEDIAQLVEQRSSLLGIIAHQASSPDGRESATARQDEARVTALRLNLAEVEHYLAEAGIHFGS